jgi:hypothetical protein
MNTTRRPGAAVLRATIALAIACAAWLPSLRFFFQPARADVQSGAASPRAQALLARQHQLWDEPARRAGSIAAMRDTNPEWDFMSRTFLVMALANVALDEATSAAERRRSLATIDTILADTLGAERAHGMHHFLLPYGRRAPFHDPAGRSVFIDGEIAMMLAVRQLVEDSPRWRTPLRERVAHLERSFAAAPLGLPESYPDEGWTFCNTTALAAVRIADVTTGADHRPLVARWLRAARAHLIDRRTGMLVSSFTYDGRALDGPEGSSIYWSAHMLRFVSPEGDAFARDQYRRATRHLDRHLLGFGWSQEWANAGLAATRADVDSGPIVPIVGASAGASGMSLVGAAAFDDPDRLASLLASLDLAAFPMRAGATLRYAASNQVGDAALLYALTFGPTLETFRTRTETTR